MWGKWKKLSRTYKYFLYCFIILAAINAAINIYVLIITASFDAVPMLFLIFLFIDFFISLFAGTIGFIIARTKRDKITKPEIGFATFIGLIIALSVYLSFPYTKPLTGKVVDAKTNKPIKGAYVEVDWKAGSGPEGSSITYKSGVYITKKDGSFTVPAAIDHLWFPLEVFNMQEITVFAHGYHFRGTEKGLFILDKNTNYLAPKSIATGSKVRLIPLSSEQEWESNWKLLKDHNNNMPPPDIVDKVTNFLVKDTEIFAKRFPNSAMAPAMMLKGADIYYGERIQHLRYNNLAIKQYEKVAKLFPGSSEASTAVSYIQYIKQNPY